MFPLQRTGTQLVQLKQATTKDPSVKICRSARRRDRASKQREKNALFNMNILEYINDRCRIKAVYNKDYICKDI
jgi:hypothetical protein